MAGTKHEADNGEVDLDFGETEGAEVEIDAPEETNEERVVVETVEKEAAPEDNKAEQEEYSASVKKRIDRLTKKMRDAERREQEAIRYAQTVQGEMQTTKNRMQALDQGFVNEYGSRIAAEQQQAEQQLKAAKEVGDTDLEVEAQKKMAQLAVSADKYTQAQQNAKQQLAVAQQRQQQAAQYVQQPAPPPEVAPDPQAEDWAEKNDWFGKDQAMTFAAFGIHKGMVEEDGFDPATNEYYSELDRRIHKEFPHKFSNGNGTKRPAQSVTGVSRSTSGRKHRVKLTPTQVSIAKKLGVPLEEYAKYVKE
jgi:hypothetical protein